MADSRTSSLIHYRAFAKAFEARDFRPLYLFYGDESYFIEELQELAIKYAIDEELKDFNFELMYGDETPSAEAIERCMTLPMMDARRLVIIRRFEQMAGKRLWAAYAKRPNPQAVVILICTGRPAFRALPFKTLKEKKYATEFKRLTARQRSTFVQSLVKSADCEIDDDAVACLLDYVGTSLRSVVGELEKLKTFAAKNARLTRDDVVCAIGQSREINSWELSDAVLQGRLADAERIAAQCVERSTNRSSEAIRLVTMIGSQFARVWQAKDLLQRENRFEEVSASLRIPDFMVRRYVNVARRFTLAELRGLFSVILAADCELKGESPREARLVLTLMLRKMHRLAPNAYRGTARRSY